MPRKMAGGPAHVASVVKEEKMRRFVVVIAAVCAVLLGGITLTMAQDTKAPEAEGGSACASPIASPAAAVATAASVAPATPAATPEACGTPTAAAGEVTVAIKDFAYDPASVEVPVGGSITWTNQDSTKHTATAKDKAILQSGALDQGESFTQTFTMAGTYEYFCEFHANMKGTIVVK